MVCVAAAAAALQLAAGAPDDVFASKRVFSGDVSVRLLLTLFQDGAVAAAAVWPAGTAATAEHVLCRCMAETDAGCACDDVADVLLSRADAVLLQPCECRCAATIVEHDGDMRRACQPLQGTYYGDRKRGFGHCSFHFHGFGDSKGYVGTPLAINAAQYKGTAVCGLCVKYRGTGVGLGYNPISTAWQPGFICDECPECRFGDLDKQMNGDGRCVDRVDRECCWRAGPAASELAVLQLHSRVRALARAPGLTLCASLCRWRIEWYAVQCPVGDSTFRYGFQRGNAWYRKMMVRRCLHCVARHAACKRIAGSQLQSKRACMT